jgi:NitT/TauT family transport system substrate-binding protein
MKAYDAVLAVVVLAGLGAGIAWNYPAPTETPGPVIFGTPPYEAATLIIVAADRGFFEQNGLNVTIRNYSSSLESANGLLKNETDMAYTSEYVAASKILGGKDIRIAGCAARYQSLYIVGRQDAGIGIVADLNGTTIGLVRGGPSEFYLGRFLDLHGMSIADVTLVNVQPPGFVDAIANGSVDAVVVASMHTDAIETRLGGAVVTWPVQSNQPGYNLIVTRGDWATGHPEEIGRVLTSLAQADEYVIGHPNETKALVQKRLNYTEADMARIWPEYTISLNLDRSLLTVMADEGRWMIANNLTNATAIPDFRGYVDTAALEQVRPDAVNNV